MPASKSHSQIISTFHPASSSFCRTRQSRSTVRRNLADQNSTLLAGIVVRLQPCRCQKQPCTNSAKRYLGNTKSGVPGKSDLWIRNRCPALCNLLRTMISGAVSFDRTLAMIALRLVWSTWLATLISLECPRVSDLSLG